jgi:enterobactin synthetase component D
MKHFQVSFKQGTEHGLIVGISLPNEHLDTIPTYAIRQLRKQEYEKALEFNKHRRNSFIGGRIAARICLDSFNIECGPILINPDGSPMVPDSVSLSISHKKNMAVAIIGWKENGTLGIDIEDLCPSRMGIQKMVLTKTEEEDLQKLPEERQWNDLLVRFSCKEAIYKSLSPYHPRSISFQDVAAFPNLNQSILIRLYLKNRPYPNSISGRYIWLPNHIITTVISKWNL